MARIAKIHSDNAGLAVRTFHSVPRLELVAVPSAADIRQTVKQYASNPEVQYAEPNYIVYPTDTIPNDTLFSQQWDLHNIGDNGGVAGADIDVLKAWDLSTGDPSVVVGVVDTGVAYTHPDLAANLLPGYSTLGADYYDTVGHGTHVSGTIGGVGNNGQGVSGVNWRVSMLPCQFLTASGGTTADAITCLDYIAQQKEQGKNIIATNNSWGGPAYSQSLHDAIARQLDDGILFIAAAGNGGSDDLGDNNDSVSNYPSNFDLPNVIAVAATDRTDSLAYFSNFGRHSVHISAPGVSILSTIPPNTWELYSGTSMATPHVTGAAALLAAYNPKLTWWQIRNLLLTGGQSLPALAQTISGNRLDVYGAMTCSNRSLAARLEPRADLVATTVDSPIKLEVLNINCADPAGAVTIAVSDGSTITLHDDGLNGDGAAGDGIYTALWTPPTFGSYVLSFPGSDNVTVQSVKPYTYQVAAQPYQFFTGTSLNLSDESTGGITSPFPIRFGGQLFTQIYVADNGFLTLDSPFINPLPVRLPYAAAGTMIAPFWDDLDPQPGTANNIFWDVLGSAPSRELVVEWRNVPHWPYVNDGTVQFEVVFHEDRDNVEFNYADVSFGGVYTANLDSGARASVGLQVSPTQATQYSLDTPSLSAGTTIEWKLADPDFKFAIQDSSVTVYPNATTYIYGSVQGLYTFAGPVAITCAGAGAPPTCNGTTVNANSSAQNFTLTASAPSAGVFNFTIQGQGNGLTTITHSQPFTLNVIDFSLGTPAPNPLVIADGTSASFTLPITPLGPFNGSVFLSCSGLPSGMSCAFSPAQPVLQPGATTNVTVTITAPNQTKPGSYPLTITAASGVVRTASNTVNVTANPDFFLSTTISSLRGDGASGIVTVDQQDSYTGTVRLTCSVVPAGPTCGLSQSSVSTFPTPITLMIAANGGSGNYTVNFTATDGTKTRQFAYPYTLADYSLSVPQSGTINLTSPSVSLTLGSINGFSGTILISCASPDPKLTCSAYPVSLSPGSSATAAVYFQYPNAAVSGSIPVTLTFTVQGGGVIRSAVITITPQTFAWAPESTQIPPVLAGQSLPPILLDFTPYNGFALPMTLQPWSGGGGGAGGGVAFPALQSVTVSPTTVTPAGSPVVVTLNATAPLLDDPQYPDGSATFDVGISPAPPAPYIPPVGMTGGPFHVPIIDYELDSPFNNANVYAGPSRGIVVPGHSFQTTITYKTWNGFNAPLQLSCPDPIGPGLTCSFDKPTLQPGDVATMTIAADSSASPANWTINISGTSTMNGVTIAHSFPLAIDVAQFSVSVSPDIQYVPSGGSATYQVLAPHATLPPDPATLACTTTDPGVTCEYRTNMPDDGASVTLHTTGGLTTPGAHNFTVTVTQDGANQSASATIFMKGQDSLTLTGLTGSNANNIVPTGTQATISWTFTGSPGANVNLDLVNGSAVVANIATAVPVGQNGSGSYIWTVPNIPLGLYGLRVTSTTNPVATDVMAKAAYIGNGIFFSDVQIDILYVGTSGSGLPYQGVAFFMSSGVKNARVDLMKNGQLIKNVFNGAVSISGASAAFVVAGPDTPPGTGYSLLATPLDGTAQPTTSKTFIISETGIIVTSPAGGEIWQPGSTHLVTWTWTGNPISPGSDVSISLGSSGTPILLVRDSSIGANGSGSANVTIPATAPPRQNGYLISIVSYALPPIYGAASLFSVGTPHNLTVTSNGSTGSVTGAVINGGGNLGINCPSACSTQVVEGTSVELFANQAYFTGWSGGGCSGTSFICEFTVGSSDVNIVANFSGPPSIALTGPSNTTLPAIHPGGSATFDVTLVPSNGAATNVTLSCIGLPFFSTCSFTQNGFSASQATTITVIIKTTGPSGALIPGSLFGTSWSLGLAVGLVWLGTARRGRRKLLLLLCLAVLLQVSCGGGGGGGSSSTTSTGGTGQVASTPTGNYTVTITAVTANSGRASTQVTLPIQ